MRRLSRPVLAVVLLILWFAASFAASAVAGRPMTPGETPVDYLARGVARPLAAAVGVLLLGVALLRWRGLGLGAPRPGTLRLLWLPVVYLLLFSGLVASAPLPPADAAAFLLINALLIGLSEELMFRGVLLSGLRDRLRPWPAILTVTFVFGLAHVANVLMTGDLRAAAVQSGNAAVTGLMLAALRLRTGSLWPPVLIHALWNYALFLLTYGEPLPEPGTLAVGQLIAPTLALLPLGLYGVWLLRNAGRDGDGLGPVPPSQETGAPLAR